MTIQLADRTLRRPIGIVEDLLVKVKDLVFPADFYIMDMTDGVVGDSTIILGRPFLRTANALISMKDGSISMEVGDKRIDFNIYEATRYPSEEHAVGLNAVGVVSASESSDPLSLKLTPLPKQFTSVIPISRAEILHHLESSSFPPSKPFASIGDVRIGDLNYQSVDCISPTSSPSAKPDSVLLATCSNSIMSSADGPSRDSSFVVSASCSTEQRLMDEACEKKKEDALPFPVPIDTTKQDDSPTGKISLLLSQLLVSLFSCGSLPVCICGAGIKKKKQRKAKKKKMKRNNQNDQSNEATADKMKAVEPRVAKSIHHNPSMKSSLYANNEHFEPP